MTRRAAAAAATLVLLCVAAPAPAAGQDLEPGPVRLTVSALDGVLEPAALPGAGADPTADGEAPARDLRMRVLVENRGGEPVDDLTLLVEVFDRVAFRTQLHAALDDGARRRLLEAERYEVADGEGLAPGEVAAIAVEVPERAIGWSATGVYPVAVAVEEGGEPLDAVTTAVVVRDERAAAPVATVLGWPLDAAPWRLPSGAYPAGVAREVLPGGRLDRLVSALARRPAGAVVQPLIAAHLLEDLADRADGFVEVVGSRVEEVPADAPAAVQARTALERIREQTASLPPPVTGPYADAALAALTDRGLDADAAQLIAAGATRLHEVLGHPPRPEAMWATSALDRATLREVLEPAGLETVLLPWQQLAVAEDAERPDFTPPPVQRLRSGGAAVTGVVADPWLVDLLASVPDRHGPVVAAQRIVAETALLHLEAPAATDRGVVLLPPPAWDVDPRVPTLLLESLASASWVELVGLDELLDRVEADGADAALGRGDGAALTDAFVRALDGARFRLAATREAIAGGDVAGRTWEELELQLQRAPSAWWLPDRRERARAMVAGVEATLDEALGTVELPARARITLTDTEQQVIPVTLSRPSGAPIRVVVELNASAKLTFPEGDARLVTLEPGGRQTISVPAVPQAAGRIPVRVLVKTPGAIDPEGTPWVQLADATVVVQSTALSGNALAILGGVFGALALWWLYRRLRPRSAQLTLVRDDAP